MKHLLFLFLLLALCACNGKRARGGAGGDTLSMRYAHYLTMVKRSGGTAVTITNPWHPDKVLHQYNITRPFRRLVVFTTAHCQLLQWLGAGNSIVGVCDARYILVPQIRQRLALPAGNPRHIADCGNSMQPDVERIIALKPDAIIASPFDNGGYGALEHLGIPIIEAADYMETSALGRAEWMRFYGLLVGRQQQADSLFNVVQHNYLALRRKAARLPLGRGILTERLTGNVWYCPGGASSMGIIFRDAHAGYFLSGNRQSGSLALSPEQVLAQADKIAVWAFKTDTRQPLTLQQLLQEYHGYSLLKAFRQHQVYQCLTSRVPYFEEVSWRPDWLLSDVVLLTHPGVKGKLRYFVK